MEWFKVVIKVATHITVNTFYHILFCVLPKYSVILIQKAFDDSARLGVDCS